MSLEIQISGLLFLLIIVLLIICDILGHGAISDTKSEAKLKKIVEDPNKFRISFTLLILEHLIIIALAISLFIAFSHFSILLGIIWVVFRVSESVIQMYDKKNYWKLLDIAEQYSNATETEKNGFIESGLLILQKKITVFAFSQILFSIGTVAYSILFVMYEPVPFYLGWFGIVASVIYGLGNGLNQVIPEYEAIWNLGGLLILVFELILGVWLFLLL